MRAVALGLEIFIVVPIGLLLAGLPLSLSPKESPLKAIRSVNPVPGRTWGNIEAIGRGTMLRAGPLQGGQKVSGRVIPLGTRHSLRTGGR